MDILNERDEDWSNRDWDNMPVETVEAMSDDALEQVKGLLANPNYVFTEEIGKRLVRRLSKDLAWACGKYLRGVLERQLNAAAHEVAKRANVPPPRP